MSTKSQPSEKAIAVAAMYQSGMTTIGIAKLLNVTRQSVHKHVKRAGLTRSDGGAHGRKVAAEKARRDAVDGKKAEQAMRLYGIPLDEWRDRVRDGSTLAFQRHRISAKNRGIPFELTFVQWYGTWFESGKYHLRGAMKGRYVMSRRGDEGPYAVGNVFIQTHSANSVEAGRKTRALQIAARSAALAVG